MGTRAISSSMKRRQNFFFDNRHFISLRMPRTGIQPCIACYRCPASGQLAAACSAAGADARNAQNRSDIERPLSSCWASSLYEGSPSSVFCCCEWTASPKRLFKSFSQERQNQLFKILCVSFWCLLWGRLRPFLSPLSRLPWLQWGCLVPRLSPSGDRCLLGWKGRWLSWNPGTCRGRTQRQPSRREAGSFASEFSGVAICFSAEYRNRQFTGWQYFLWKALYFHGAK